METAITKTTELSLEYAPFKAELQATEKEFETVNAIMITDNKSHKQVHEGRMSLKNKRLAIESKRKALNEDALKWQRDNNAMAKTLIEFFETKEEMLQLKQDAYTQEQERIKQEEVRKEQEALNNRINSLAKYGAAHDVIELKTMPDEAFESLLLQHKTSYDSEQLRIANEKEMQLQESKRQQKEADRLKQESEKLKADQAELVLQKKKLTERLDVVYNSRLGLLHGYECKKIDGAYTSPDGKSSMLTQDIYECDDQAFNQFANDCRAQYDKIITDRATAAEAKRIQEETLKKNQEETERIRREARSAALAPDKEKFLIYIESLLGVRCTPPVHSDSKTLLIQFEIMLKQACESLAKQVNNL